MLSFADIKPLISVKVIGWHYFAAFYLIGRGERIRTSDPLVPNQVRYQAALHPDINGKGAA